MHTEIERKFLVTGDFSADVYASKRIVQGYICSQPGKTVRIRLEDAEQLLRLCEPGAIDKVRHLAKVGNHVWEIDVFHGANEGLVMAEIELKAEEESFVMPAWAGKEVTGDRRYYNSMLTQHPFTEWNQ